jgi:hypothetical protein
MVYMGEAYLKPGFRVARLARKGERWRPATMSDVIVERGEFVGNGVADWEPLSFHKRVKVCE